ncbi:hypothetical protein ACROYT_G017697 [Oculina patagonica]
MKTTLTVMVWCVQLRLVLRNITNPIQHGNFVVPIPSVVVRIAWNCHGVRRFQIFLENKDLSPPTIFVSRRSGRTLN